MQKRIIKLIVFGLALIIPLNSTLSYFSSKDSVTNTLTTENYNISIYTEGGNVSFNIVIKNNKVTLPEATKEGYVFQGYSFTKDGDIIYYAHDMVNIEEINNKILYTIWEEEKTSVNAVDYIKSLAETDSINLIKDDGTDDHNIRYYGTNPNNYVKFNESDNDVWRIVGLFNNIENSSGVKSERIKLVREVDIGRLVWDNDEADVNDGYGLNDWSDAHVMKLLNPNYDNFTDATYSSCSYDFDLGKTLCTLKSSSEKVNNSLWWNNKKGLCYNSPYKVVTECDFTSGNSIGPSNSAKSMIDDVVWNLGGIAENFYDEGTGTAQAFYGYEHSSTVYDCSGTDNRKCPRKEKWLGKVALIYPSDYAFATSGGATFNRNQCLNMSLNYWGMDDNGECVANNYLFKRNRMYLSSSVIDNTTVMSGAWSGYVATAPASFSNYVYPAVFLKENIAIISGTGTSDDPYILNI